VPRSLNDLNAERQALLHCLIDELGRERGFSAGARTAPLIRPLLSEAVALAYEDWFDRRQGGRARISSTLMEALFVKLHAVDDEISRMVGRRPGETLQ
jgi:hypothetical protein